MVSSDYRFSRWARGPLFFFLIKRTKNQDSKEVSFRSGPCRTKPAEPGLQPFALLRSLSPPLLQKLLCPAAAHGLHCSARFLAETALLTEESILCAPI